MTEMRSASCRCGKIELQMVGEPILRGICYCQSCQQAGRLHQAEAGANCLLAADGGTDYVLYRKDRVRCVSGGDLLEERRLKPDSPTRRMFARCCNSAMFLDFTKGHWLTVYRARLGDDIPPATMRMMTADRPDGPALTDDIANYRGQSPRFMLKLLGAWAAMGFRRPAVVGVLGDRAAAGGVISCPGRDAAWSRRCEASVRCFAEPVPMEPSV